MLPSPTFDSLVSALVGGALIGASATMLLVLNGRVAGVSGIVSALLRPVRGEVAWRALFLFGLALGGLLLAWLCPAAIAAPSASSARIVVAGLLVGVGTQLGSGCTSGHGVCGVSRLSRRSLVATATFMVTGAIATFALLHRVAP